MGEVECDRVLVENSTPHPYHYMKIRQFPFLPYMFILGMIGLMSIFGGGFMQD